MCSYNYRFICRYKTNQWFEIVLTIYLWYFVGSAKSGQLALAYESPTGITKFEESIKMIISNQIHDNVGYQHQK